MPPLKLRSYPFLVLILGKKKRKYDSYNQSSAEEITL